MNYQYIKAPNEITLQEYLDNDCCLAPSKYSKFIANESVYFKTLDSLCTESIKKTKIKEREKYHYSEIGDIEVSNGKVSYASFWGLNMPSENPKELKQHDIVISTVRTYRGGVGFITDNVAKHCCSPAILVIRNVSEEITKEYLFAVLRTNFFVEQILGFQNRGMYPRLDKDAMKNILIPIPKEKKVIDYITILVKAYLNKLSLIKKRHETILENIEKELLANQKEATFEFQLPTIQEVEEVGRLDTSRYCIAYKKYEHLIKNYKHDFFKLSELGYAVKRGQNLQVSNIGQSHYSNKEMKGFYKLAVSANFSEHSTVEEYDFLGNINKLSKIKKGEIIFSARGAQFGRVVIFPENIENTITNIDSLVISNQEDNLTRNIFITMFLNNLRQNKHIYKIAITGSGANSLTQYQSDDINFPNFSESKQQQIAKLYHNANIDYETTTFDLSNFLVKDAEYNAAAGIYELDKTAKYLKNILNQAIDDIVNDREVKIAF